MGDEPAKKRARVENIPRSTQWCGTLNNPTKEEYWLFQNICSDAVPNSAVQYLIFGQEKAPDTGTPHLQWYCKMKSTTSLVGMKKVLGDRSHMEATKGSSEQNIAYCKKDDDWQEFGTPPKGQGHRSDLTALHSDLRMGMGMQEVSNVHFPVYLRNPRAIRSWVDLNTTAKMRSVPTIYWLYGASGAGKSVAITAMVAAASKPTFFLSGGVTGAWWTGYDAQNIVVMDDLRGAWMPHSHLLRILDSHPHRVSVHGGNVALVAETFYISTNLAPALLYQEDPNGALMRRLHEWAYVVHYNGTSSKCIHWPTKHESREEPWLSTTGSLHSSSPDPAGAGP